MTKQKFHLVLNGRQYTPEEAKIWIEAKLGEHFYVVFDHNEYNFIIMTKLDYTIEDVE